MRAGECGHVGVRDFLDFRKEIEPIEQRFGEDRLAVFNARCTSIINPSEEPISLGYVDGDATVGRRVGSGMSSRSRDPTIASASDRTSAARPRSVGRLPEIGNRLEDHRGEPPEGSHPLAKAS